MSPPPEIKPQAFVRELLGRSDYAIIGEIVEPNTKVLDLGCGEVELLQWLAANKGVDARGVELSGIKVQRAIGRGVSVFQCDIDEGLADYPDGAFDYVILSQTLQETRQPRKVLREMLRVGRRAIVAFPNFGHWRVRASMLFSGRAPSTSLASTMRCSRSSHIASAKCPVRCSAARSRQRSHAAAIRSTNDTVRGNPSAAAVSAGSSDRPSTARTLLSPSASTLHTPTTLTNELGSPPTVSFEKSSLIGSAAAPIRLMAMAAPASKIVLIVLLAFIAFLHS